MVINILALVSLTYGFKANINDPLCNHQKANILRCHQFNVYEEEGQNDFVDFTVRFPFYYSSDIAITKYPMSIDDVVIVEDKEIVWNGSYRLRDACYYRGCSNTKKKHTDDTQFRFPRSVISFYNSHTPEDYGCHHFYYLQCSGLDSLLERKRKKRMACYAGGECRNGSARNIFYFAAVITAVFIGFYGVGELRKFFKRRRSGPQKAAESERNNQ